MRNDIKGIILAGGTGSRLHPLTKSVSKQLLPIYDKPMIYYPLSTLMHGNIRDFLIITTPRDEILFKKLLGNGEKLGISIEYAVQQKPDGIAQAFLIAGNSIKNKKVALILGDNLFHGKDILNLGNIFANNFNASIFAYEVKDPERYAVIEFNDQKEVVAIEEKPKKAKSKFAVTGLYFYDETVLERAKFLKPSARGELEITDVNNSYLNEKKLEVNLLSRGTVWLDTGTFESLHEAGSYIRTIENRQGMKICCPEEIAWNKGWINDRQLEKLSLDLLKSGYGEYLLELLNK